MLADVLKAGIRTTDFLVRIRGDEFMLLLPDTRLRAGRNLADRLKASVERLEVHASARNRLGISVGLAHWQANMSVEDWIKRADEGLYRAKINRRLKICSVQSSR